jgi:putative ABC transport system permease protein
VTVFFSTSAKIAWRELRSAPSKFLFVVLAVAVGVGALSGVKGFGLAFKSMLLRNAKQLIAADLQAQVWNLPTDEQMKKVVEAARTRGVMTQVTETVSMAGSDYSNVPQMVSVKAVDPTVYPLYGELVVDPKKPLGALLKDDTALVNPELLLRMKLKPGEQLRLGGKSYLIVGTLVTETDRLASGFGPGMRVLVSREGLERSGLIQFGSRAAQRFLFKLNPGVNVDKFKDQLRDALPHTFISDFRDGDAAVARGIDNATIFLSLISLIALIVGSLGVAMAMYSHLQQKMDTIAVMKAVGARSNQIMQIYLLQTLWLGIAGGFIGVAIGAVVQRSFPLLIKRVFDMLPEVTFDWSFSLQGMCLGVLATLLFTVPPLLGIRNIRPSLVFRREMADAKKPWRERLREAGAGAAVAVLILIGFGLITVWLSDSWKMGAYFIAGLTASLVILSFAAGVLLWFMRLVVRRRGRRLPSSFRHGFANLYRPGNQARSVLAALGIGVMFTLTTYLLQRTILHEVKTEGPGRSGNLFLLDVQASQREDLSKVIEAQPGVDGRVDFIGYVVARLLKKNGVPTDQLTHLNKERRDQLQTSRITMIPQMPNTVELAEGRWWVAGDATPQAAISEDQRRFYDFKLGDRLQYQIAGRTMEFPVTAVFKRTARSTIRLDVVVPRDAMKGLPAVYVGAVRVAPKDIPTVEVAVFDKFPTVTIMNLAEILKRIQEGVDQVALVIRFLAAFAILAGIIILSASVAGTRYRRIREVAILKTLGATKQRITGIFSIEFSILGAVAGLIGGVLANIFSKIIAEKFVEASFSFDWLSLLVVTVGTALLANLAGWAASARILDQRPLEVLRGE